MFTTTTTTTTTRTSQAACGLIQESIQMSIFPLQANLLEHLSVLLVDFFESSHPFPPRSKHGISWGLEAFEEVVFFCGYKSCEDGHITSVSEGFNEVDTLLNGYVMRLIEPSHMMPLMSHGHLSKIHEIKLCQESTSPHPRKKMKMMLYKARISSSWCLIFKLYTIVNIFLCIHPSVDVLPIIRIHQVSSPPLPLPPPLQAIAQPSVWPQILYCAARARWETRDVSLVPVAWHSPTPPQVPCERRRCSAMPPCLHDFCRIDKNGIVWMVVFFNYTSSVYGWKIYIYIILYYIILYYIILYYINGFR